MSQLQKRRLGRGLAALIGDDDTAPVVITGQTTLPIEFIKANPSNPRKNFNTEELESLSQSIKAKGVLQPIVVRPASSGGYEIIAGERRWRAAQKALLHDVPVIIKDLDDQEALEIALIENIQRSDLNPLEEALGYKQLIDQYTYTQQQLADGVGKSRSHIANTLRLLTLPEEVRKKIEAGLLTAGHARALVATNNPGEIADRIIRLGMSVRDAEDLVRQPRVTKPAKTQKDADTRAIEKSIAEAIGLAVDIKHDGKSGGCVTISYKTLDQLDDLTRRLTR